MFHGRHFAGDGCPTHSEEPELKTMAQIAKRLGATLYSVRRWYERRATVGFPEYVRKELAESPDGVNIRANNYLFDWREIEAWYFFWTVTRRK